MNFQFLVAVDYFTKWAEAEALANIRDADVKKFVWRNIVTRFEVPESLVSDNWLQFDSKASVNFVATSASGTGILPRHTRRAAAKLRPLTKPL